MFDARHVLATSRSSILIGSSSCSISDTGAKRYYFESSYSPTIFWVDIDKLKLAAGAQPAKLDLKSKPLLDGEVSDKFVPAEPFKFLAP